MYTPSDIKNSARKINDKRNDLRIKESGLKSDVRDLKSWWMGKGSISFIQGYNETEVEINRLYAEISNLESALKGLASAVERADDERRREAERIRLEELRRKSSQAKK
ncbi:WXG100 family type VII secretion target [Ruminiclostridium herbifermentans]|uniref:WXG100 family type VII secretion target n=1 Tax=Ruminiclostridium herbifermentans TaxID=2488810 RepID=A0A4U7JCG1_9FIRM|nr:WXG100 family type VII secretion target [Ruminiclostridium herbifermentans]QNU67812.1 WXG100 family type VII secretion target [Ruminiclostridium herbifermentans]